MRVFGHGKGPGPGPSKPSIPRDDSPPAWRRLHDGNLIAELILNQGLGVYRASAYRVTDRKSEVAYSGRGFSLLTDGQQGADELVEREFGHECRTGECGKWLRWSGKDPTTDD